MKEGEKLKWIDLVHVDYRQLISADIPTDIPPKKLSLLRLTGMCLYLADNNQPDEAYWEELNNRVGEGSRVANINFVQNLFRKFLNEGGLFDFGPRPRPDQHPHSAPLSSFKTL